MYFLLLTGIYLLLHFIYIASFGVVLTFVINAIGHYLGLGGISILQGILFSFGIVVVHYILDRLDIN